MDGNEEYTVEDCKNAGDVFMINLLSKDQISSYDYSFCLIDSYDQ